MNKIALIVFFIIMIILFVVYIVLSALGINIIAEIERSISGESGAIFKDPMYAVFSIGFLIIIVVAFFLLKFGSEG